jgi:hypothetical protein
MELEHRFYCGSVGVVCEDVGVVKILVYAPAAKTVPIFQQRQQTLKDF